MTLADLFDVVSSIDVKNIKVQKGSKTTELSADIRQIHAMQFVRDNDCRLQIYEIKAKGDDIIIVLEEYMYQEVLEDWKKKHPYPSKGGAR